MPSTHAIVGFVVPGSVIIFTMYRYIYPFSLLLAASMYVFSCTDTSTLSPSPSYIYVRIIMYRDIYPFPLLLDTSMYVLFCTDTSTPSLYSLIHLCTYYHVQIHLPLLSTPSYIYVRILMYRYIYPFSLLLATSMYVLSCTETYTPSLYSLIHLCTYYSVQIHLPLPSTP